MPFILTGAPFAKAAESAMYVYSVAFSENIFLSPVKRKIKTPSMTIAATAITPTRN